MLAPRTPETPHQRVTQALRRGEREPADVPSWLRTLAPSCSVPRPHNGLDSLDDGPPERLL